MIQRKRILRQPHASHNNKIANFFDVMKFHLMETQKGTIEMKFNYDKLRNIKIYDFRQSFLQYLINRPFSFSHSLFGGFIEMNILSHIFITHVYVRRWTNLVRFNLHDVLTRKVAWTPVLPFVNKKLSWFITLITLDSSLLDIWRYFSHHTQKNRE